MLCGWAGQASIPQRRKCTPVGAQPFRTVFDLKITNYTMKKYFIYFYLLTLIGCYSGKILSRKNQVDDWLVDYTLMGAVPRQHSPYTIHVTANSGKDQYLYWFFANTDYVQKSKGFRGKGVTDYYLVFDSGYSYTMNKWDSLGYNESVKNNGKVFPLSKLDSTVFQKIIFYSDSLKLKNFNFLKRGKYFKVVATKEK